MRFNPNRPAGSVSGSRKDIMYYQDGYYFDCEHKHVPMDSDPGDGKAKKPRKKPAPKNKGPEPEAVETKKMTIGGGSLPDLNGTEAAGQKEAASEDAAAKSAEGDAE